MEDNERDQPRRRQLGKPVRAQRLFLAIRALRPGKGRRRPLHSSLSLCAAPPCVFSISYVLILSEVLSLLTEGGPLSPCEFNHHIIASLFIFLYTCKMMVSCLSTHKLFFLPARTTFFTFEICRRFSLSSLPGRRRKSILNTSQKAVKQKILLVCIISCKLCLRRRERGNREGAGFSF